MAGKSIAQFQDHEAYLISQIYNFHQTLFDPFDETITVFNGILVLAIKENISHLMGFWICKPNHLKLSTAGRFRLHSN